LRPVVFHEQLVRVSQVVHKIGDRHRLDAFRIQDEKSSCRNYLTFYRKKPTKEPKKI
jgi:hypothetical protein